MTDERLSVTVTKTRGLHFWTKNGVVSLYATDGSVKVDVIRDTSVIMQRVKWGRRFK